MYSHLTNTLDSVILGIKKRPKLSLYLCIMTEESLVFSIEILALERGVFVVLFLTSKQYPNYVRYISTKSNHHGHRIKPL